jgi:hypothetical protein
LTNFYHKYKKRSALRLFDSDDSRFSEGVIIGKNSEKGPSAIAGLNRNPLVLKGITSMDAPASSCGAGLSGPA